MRNLSLLLGLCLLIVSCNDEETATPTASFETATSQAAENINQVTLPVVLDQDAPAAVEIEFELAGSAALDGDYELLTESPLIIPAGSRSGNIVVQVINDELVEPNTKELIVELTSASGAQVGQAQSVSHTLTISDDDNAPQNDLQFDLSWSLGAGRSINEVDLDLLLITDVVVENNEIVDFTLVDLSDDVTGFESLVLSASQPDQEYYIVALYATGNQEVSYSLGLHNAGIGSEFIEDSFMSSEEGYAGIYGPIAKNGTNYGGKQGAQIAASKMKLNPALNKQ